MWVCLAWNALCVLSVWLTNTDSGSGTFLFSNPPCALCSCCPAQTSAAYSNAGGMQTVWACVYLVMGIPGAWNLWYSRIYEGTRDDSTRKWLMFFINFVVSGHCFHIVCTALTNLNVYAL